ncbi:Uncharacterized protein D0Z07_1411 [Hyphodiscus hymeniophilus]|uniref:Subtelomeric hrmA-associated cluster protein AFUB-079030/YDR124W-like helical bundle domain-containing protein n=1 Tax=Hyphodiscus hymeniophilus TaxID=353542 RepID=A0A9P6VR84_9HELO|nr:Uncharacterized protein D0Z07_1411 [Hyphodiscus hymeniophilus]
MDASVYLLRQFILVPWYVLPVLKFTMQKLIPPKSIEAALRDCVRLPVKEFALIVQLENGEERTYTSQSLTPWQPRIFGDRFRQDFRRSVHRAASEASYPGSAYPDGGALFPEFDTDDNPRFSSSGDSSSGGRIRHPYQRQTRSEESDGTDSGKGKRKRLHGPQYSSFDNDDTPVPVPVVKVHQITIGNEAEVEEFYVTRFKEMQQSSCKVMGKVFVKLVEPKKQTHHPYTKGNDKAPPWWPKTTGENHVRHREPDHLLRPERIRLLVHILRMIIEPFNSQCEAVRKSGLNVQKLEDVTMEAMSAWFNDSDHPGNLAKKPFLKEIFKVAKAEERYRNGEIDKDTRISVMYGDRSGVDFSDDETEEGVKDEEEEVDTTIQIPSNLPTPDSMVSQPMMQNPTLQHAQEHEPNSMFIGSTRPLPVRYHTQPVLDEHTSYSNQAFVPRTVGVGVGFQTQPPPNPQDPNRRSFVSPVYPSPQSMYGWQNTTMTSNGTMNPNYYVTSPQTPLSAQSGQFQLPPPPPPQQPMLPPMTQHHFDSLPTTRQFDSGPAMGNVVRTGSLGHPHHMPHGFQNYLQDNGYGNNDSDVRDEHQQLHNN